MDFLDFKVSLDLLGCKNNEMVVEKFIELYSLEKEHESILLRLNMKVLDNSKILGDLERENNDLKENIKSLNDLLGRTIVKPYVSEYYLYNQKNKFNKQLYESYSKKSEEYRAILDKKPKISPLSRKNYDEIDQILELETLLEQKNKELEIIDIEHETKVFALTEEISELYQACTRLGLSVPPFDPRISLQRLFSEQSSSK